MKNHSNNWGRTRPLSNHARGVLAQCAETPLLRHTVNPGVVDRLTRGPEPLAEVVHEGDRKFLRPTDAGRKLLTPPEG